MRKENIFVTAFCLSLLVSVPETMLAVESVQTVLQQGRTISGKVTDQNGEPIIGANVVVKGTSNGVITDVDGNFELRNASGKLVVSYIGYQIQEVSISGKSNLLIRLSEDSEVLDEVVVTGYGVQKKASLTSAISQIKGEEAFKNKGIANATVALQGEIPGLTITRSSTRPGSEGAAMKIRGDISVNGNSSPLIIIDGISGSLDELNAMDASDIENISVLKDASAAIYGARSASGVVLVTTKKGKKGKAQITYNGSISRTFDGIQPPITTNAEWLDMFFEAQYNDAAATRPNLTDPRDIYQNMDWWIFNSFGGPTLDTSDIDPETGAPTIYKGYKLFNALRSGKVLTLQNGDKVERWNPNTYMQDYLYGQATSHKHNISISGADDKFSYRASLGYAENNSQLKVAEDGEKKYSARLNADYQALDFLKFETNMAYEKRDIVNPSTDVGAGYFDPWFWPIWNENGDVYDTFSGSRNPVGGLTQGGQNKNSLTTFRGGLKATLDFSKWGLEGLTLSGTGNYKLVRRDQQKVYNKVQYYDWVGTETGNKQGPGSLEEIMEKWENITLGGFINYDRIFKEKHSVSAMLGMTAEQETSKKVGAKRNQGPMYPGSDLTDLDVWVSGDNNGAYGGQSSWGFVSYLGRVNYVYDDKYSIELLGRRDGSSKLSKEQRWKNFYSVSGFWRISSEEFMKDFTWLSDLKVRYNYGKTGSVTGIDNYERYALIKTGGTIFGVNPTSHTSLWIDGIRSDQRTWETINSHDVGVDFAFLNNRLRGSFDYFIKRNNGMFINVEYPSILGAGAPKTNNGKFEAKGWEIALNWNDKIGQVTYNLGASLSDAWSKVLELENNENVPNPGKNSNRLIGKPRDALYVYQTDGIFQTQEEVDAYYEMYYWNASHTGPKPNNIIPAPQEASAETLRPGARKVVDLNGDGSITTADLYYAGDMAPRLTFGIKAGLEWKGIDVAAFFQGVGKQTILRSGYLAAPWTTNYVLQNSTFMGKMWTPENPDAEYTIASRNQNFNKWNYNEKDVQVQNNRYIRLKSLVIGYTIPKKWTAKAGISNLRVYFSGDDLWEWTKVKDGYDPEYGENSNNTFPFRRLLTFGVD
ncbi:TonB-dependent receptor, partial [Phocaeicola plebeius]|uniref:SusC/RagA family TonB-linked outer membrane protein n=1 Tax=Phocaeicola plebeius TaxID=310297 RepID=UPI0026EAD135